MEIITSHINLDFDGFASMVAAKKLYPEAQLVLPNVVSREVRNFLALYRSSLDLKEFTEVDLSKVKKAVIVDTSSFSRVVDFALVLNNPDNIISVYDHHMEEDSNIRNNFADIRKVGACTSILLEEIIRRGIEIKPFEATIFALGIYSDTNCLTFNSTTVQDAKAVTFLLECGAYLDVVSEFVGQPLSVKQSNAFNKLVENIESIIIKGQEIGISVVSFDEYIDEVAFLTHRILSIKDYDAVFTVILMKNRIYIVGRSTVSKINIDKIVREFNGAGHPKAGSAIVKSSTLDEIKQKLIEVLNRLVEPSLSAKDIMSYPVKTVTEDISLKEVNKIMLRYGHTGLPVIKEGSVVGMITRKDVEKAAHHGYGHSPVKAYMTKRIITISPYTPIREIQHKLIENNIGRLPVINEGELQGIVTRTDILKQTFGENSPRWYKKVYVEENTRKAKRNFSSELDNLPKDIKDILNTAGRIGDELGENIYVVGGFVRDLILGYGNLDIDIVVEGNGVETAKRISSELGGMLKIHENFKTAVVEVFDKYKIDVVTARREFYEYPAALPVVEQSSIKSDLYRRDFTLNSMAIFLNKSKYGNLIDYFGGQKDLQQGLIRILYNMSFIEDPTRIFRAVRFEQRYGFKIEEQTYEFMIDAINSDVLNQVSSERITDEILLMLKEKKSADSLKCLYEIGVFTKLYPELKIDNLVIELIMNIEKINTSNLNREIISLLVLYLNCDIHCAEKVLEKLIVNKVFKENIISFVKLKDNIAEMLGRSDLSNYEIYIALNGLSDEALNVLKLWVKDKVILKRIALFEEKLKNKKLYINGKKLQELGLKPGPGYKDILEKVFKEKLEGNINGIDEETAFVQKLINRSSEGV